jgi:hypothetical protein
LVVGITPKEILNTLGVFPITPKVLNVDKSFLDISPCIRLDK